MNLQIPIETISGTSTQIRFSRGLSKQPRLLRFRQTITCGLSINGVTVSYGTAYYNPNDKQLGLYFDVETGKKIALAKATRQLKRHLRLDFWQAYLQSRGVLKAEENAATATAAA